jgi:hypothetical protein
VTSDEQAEGTTETAVQCVEHGPRQQAFVCHHLLNGTEHGFFWGTDPEDPRNPCPDAWCAECDAYLEQHGGEWNEETEEFAQIKLICDLCYDEIRRRNLPADLEQVWLQSRYHASK